MTLRSCLLTMMEHCHSCSSLTAEGLLESVMVSLSCSNGFLLHHFFHFPFEINGNVCIRNSQLHGLPQFNPPLHEDYLLQILSLVPTCFILSLSIIFFFRREDINPTHLLHTIHNCSIVAKASVFATPPHFLLLEGSSMLPPTEPTSLAWVKARDINIMGVFLLCN